MSPDPEIRRELDATLRTREDLGPEYDDALVDSFLEKLGRRLDEVVDTRVRRSLAEQQVAAAREARSDTSGRRFGRPWDGPPNAGSVLALALISLGLAIPLIGVATQVGTAAVLITWLGIVGVNAVYAHAHLLGRRTGG
ncbi:hypothetical protein WDH52_12340 [Streptomyces sp. TRM70308]|uniref:hypothetical protein n=1 Tax=Streptomyces sp. TRM70308 TaxID=3131932 RepID=UPI003D03675C